MTFDQIRYFIAVMESNTFFEAAEKLHITQSTLSKQIMKLEKELDVRLLDRSRRRASSLRQGSFSIRTVSDFQMDMKTCWGIWLPIATGVSSYCALARSLSFRSTT